MKREYLKCPSCGVKYIDHLGLIGTCEELQKYKKTIEDIRASVRVSITLGKGRKGFIQAVELVSKILSNLDCE